MDIDKGFSYESPEEKRKGAFKILVIEIVVLIFVAFGILIALNYVGIFPIGRILPSIFSFIPVADVPRLTVKSENPNYKLILVDETGAYEFLNSFGMYDERFSRLTLEQLVPKGIIVILTNVEQKGVPIIDSQSGKMILSSSIEPLTDTRQVQVKIYMSEDVLQNSNFDISESFNSHLIFTIYKFFNQEAPLEKVEKDLSPYIGKKWFTLDRL